MDDSSTVVCKHIVFVQRDQAAAQITKKGPAGMCCAYCEATRKYITLKWCCQVVLLLFSGINACQLEWPSIMEARVQLALLLSGERAPAHVLIKK